MSVTSDISDDICDKQDDKDEDFKLEDYSNEIDSDDSFCDVPETDNTENLPDSGEKEMREAQENEYIGPILPGRHRFDKRFICIRYPGNVVNADKAIETLGGLNSISTAIDVPNRRLELRFRPDDGYCKPACGDRHNTTSFLLRVRVKKSRVKKAQEMEAKEATKQSRNTANVGSTAGSSSTCNMDVSTNLSESEQSDNVHEPMKQESSQEHVITTLTSQIQNCSVTITDDPNDLCQKNTPFETSKEGQDVLAEDDKINSKNKKNVLPTFDRNKYEDLSEDKDYELPELKVLGRVETEFRFINLCDFQYVPMTQTKADPKRLECIYDKIYPLNVPHYSWLKNDVPYFLPPAAFSRMDTVQQYVPKTEVDSHPENIIGKNKRRKAGFTNFISFSSPDVPTKPPAGIETALKVKFVQNKHLEQMRQLFNERPIWSKNAIVYRTRFSSDRLKILLPSVAYYFTSGPWKIMWVRLGYDPRKDNTARKYQTLDYRLKAMHGLGSTVTCKRNYSDYSLPYKSAPVSKQKTTILSAPLSEECSNKKQQNLNENVYVYREGTIPPSRQMFYQYCDVLVNEIQEMLAKLPDPLPGVRCHEKRGWLPSGFDVQCREIINKQVRAVLRKQMNIPEDHPTSLPRKRRRGIRIKLNDLKRRRQKKKEVVTSEEEKCEEHDEAVPSTSTGITAAQH